MTPALSHRQFDIHLLDAQPYHQPYRTQNEPSMSPSMPEVNEGSHIQVIPCRTPYLDLCHLHVAALSVSLWAPPLSGWGRAGFGIMTNILLILRACARSRRRPHDYPMGRLNSIMTTTSLKDAFVRGPLPDNFLAPMVRRWLFRWQLFRWHPLRWQHLRWLPSINACDWHSCTRGRLCRPSRKFNIEEWDRSRCCGCRGCSRDAFRVLLLSAMDSG